MTLTATASDNVAVAKVQFEVDGTAIGSAITSSPYATTWNSTGVTDGSHTVSAVAEDTSGNYATSSITIIVDNVPPVISAISTDITGTTTATITWTTEKPANSQIAYGTTTAYGSTTTLDVSLETSHSVPLSGLLPDYNYHFSVQSSDTEGHLATSTDQILSTLSAYGPGTFFADTFERANTTPPSSRSDFCRRNLAGEVAEAALVCGVFPVSAGGGAGGAMGSVSPRSARALRGMNCLGRLLALIFQADMIGVFIP